MTLTCSTWIEVDLDQLQKNIALIKSFISPNLYCLPLKANAYGHGLVEVAQAACDVDYFAVSHLHEGAQLREAGIEKPILVLGAFLEEQIEDLVNYGLEFSISSLYKAKLVEEFLFEHSLRAKVHLKVETGMQRIGARPSTALQIYELIKNSKCMSLKGVYSHLAQADNLEHHFNKVQQTTFSNFLSQIDSANLVCHLSNSSGVINGSLSFQNMVRPGLLTLGLSVNPLPDELKELHSCFSLKSRVSYFKVVGKDQGISYGHSYITTKQTRIATIPIGYGDGYRRDLSNVGSVLIRGKKYPIRGNICMDQLMVEIGDGDAYIGDEVVLIGKQGSQEIKLTDIAKLCNTIPYEILCNFNERVKRTYPSRLLAV
ncbi:MAG: Alanine racemase 1 [Chlamydiae bacterium]|nr:Alanine racemase 1 [Chlamydiota bacterium]